jgi:hypothetical protein
VTGRLANAVIPVQISGRDGGGGIAEIKVSMTEGDARKIANMSDQEALGLGPFFAMVRESLIQLVFEQG